TVFKIRYRLFKYLVMLIGLTNVLTIINYILREYLDVFIIIYLNNVLIYINGMLKEHVKYTKIVL
ncbi:hypothetical protein K469DRAFT_592823, partial [Zopfia rhizophila CBS 207.26]